MSDGVERVRIVEVGPRDGLQNESAAISTGDKLSLIGKLVDAGLGDIEVTSFVSPKAVPQLADAADVCAGLPAAEGVRFSALAPNAKGLSRAIECGVKRIAVFTAASDTFASKNINMTVDQSLDVFVPVVRDALAAGLSVRGYVSTAFVCPFEGDVDAGRVVDVCRRLIAMGVDEVAVSDTIGAASPRDVERTVGRVLDAIGAPAVALHFHDTYGTALANVYAGWQLGVRTFDASCGGLGGCPFAPGAAGNLATEDLVYMLDRMGVETGVDLNKLIDAAGFIAGVLGRDLTSRQYRRLTSRC